MDKMEREDEEGIGKTGEVEEKDNKNKGDEMMKEDERKEKEKGDEEEREEGKMRIKRKWGWTGIKGERVVGSRE